MFIFSILELLILLSIDWLNRAYTWYIKPFDRPAQPKYVETMDAKAAKFENDALGAFLLNNGTVMNYRIPQDDRLPLDLGDQSLHHGHAVAAWAFKYAVTRDTAALTALTNFVEGLSLQQPNGRLIRGRNGDAVQDDASADQATGHLSGLYYAWKYGASDRAAELIDTWATNLLMNHNCLVDSTNQPTQYGNLLGNWYVDPLGLTLLLAIYAAASKMTHKLSFSLAYEELFAKYKRFIPYAFFRLGPRIGKYYDFHRAAIHLAILHDMAPNQYTQRGLDRVYAGLRKSGNARAILLHPAPSSQDIETVKKVLAEFTLEDKQYDNLKTHSRVEPPLPSYQRSGVDDSWMRDPYAASGGSNPPSSRYQCVDWLWAYWLGRMRNFIGVNE